MLLFLLVTVRLNRDYYNMLELYIYISHGNNTWEQKHFDQIFQYSTELPPGYSLKIQEILRE